MERDSNEFVIYTRQRIDDAEQRHQSALNVVAEDQQSGRSSSRPGSRASQGGAGRSDQKQHLPAIQQGRRSFGNRGITSESSKDPDEASGAAPGFQSKYERMATNKVVSGLNQRQLIDFVNARPELFETAELAARYSRLGLSPSSGILGRQQTKSSLAHAIQEVEAKNEAMNKFIFDFEETSK